MPISTKMLALNLHELLDSEPNAFRTMRGRSADFSDTFSLRYNISCRILNGQSRPSRAVLARIALYFKIRAEDLLVNA